ncbi:MAG: retropepsin-like aspartic protease [Ignavibacteriae bacterium]|nr:retropepsin-like aspartic protease [Ignavibacteriota bacterium]
MKLRKITFLFILFLFGSGVFASEFDYLYNFYSSKDYFRLKNNFEKIILKEKWQNDFMKGIVLSTFSKPSESNAVFTDLLSFYNDAIPDSIKAEIYKHKALNHENLFEYKEALSTLKITKEKYLAYLNEEEKEEIIDDIALYDALKDELPQTVSDKTGETVQMKKDIAGLWNIPVSINGENIDFVFDTGANITVIVEYYAKKLGIKIIDSKIKVGTSTDIKVDSKAGICKELKIGNIIYNNVAILVMPDEAFTFGGGIYKIYGVLGLPVIKGFEEFSIDKTNLLTISDSPEENKYSNMCFEGFNPVIQLIHQSDSLSFTFDSGANTTMLYWPFFDLYKKDIEEKYKLTEIIIGGAGGIKKFKGYKLENVTFKTGNLSAEIEDIDLIIEKVKNKYLYFYGNLGQDYLKKFKQIKFNFKSMFIEFN